MDQQFIYNSIRLFTYFAIEIEDVKPGDSMPIRLIKSLCPLALSLEI